MNTLTVLSLSIVIMLVLEHHTTVSRSRSTSRSTSRSFHRNMFRGLEKMKKRQHISPKYPPASEVCFGIEQLIELKQQFESFIDKNRDGKATVDEVRKYLEQYNDDVTEDQAQAFLDRRNNNRHDNVVDFIPDYLSEMAQPSNSVGMAREWFDLEDANHDGVVSKQELVDIALNIGMSQEDAEEIAMGFYMGADVNGDGVLTWEEYSTLY